MVGLRALDPGTVLVAGLLCAVIGTSCVGDGSFQVDTGPVADTVVIADVVAAFPFEM